MGMFLNLTNKRILVVGASSGIGQATAFLLDECGARVDLIARRYDKLEENLQKMSNKENHRAWKFDVSEIEKIESFFDLMIDKDESHKLDGLVYCVGYDEIRPLCMLKHERIYEMMNTNFMAFVEFARQFGNKKNSNDGGSVVVISSIASLEGGGGKVAYSATKGAIDASVRSMAKDLSVRNIRVNTVNPGVVQTELVDRLKANMPEGFRREMDRQYLGEINPCDVADLIAFLLSNKSKKITGQSIVIDGGLTSNI